MKQKDKDNYFATMVMWNMLDEWANNPESEINEKDKHKIKTIQKMIIELLIQYGKREGKLNLQNLMDESKNYKFAILKDNENIELSETFNQDMVLPVVKKIVVENSFNCFICDKTDFKNCNWFALRNLLNEEKKECKGCPYKGVIL